MVTLELMRTREVFRFQSTEREQRPAASSQAVDACGRRPPNSFRSLSVITDTNKQGHEMFSERMRGDT